MVAHDGVKSEGFWTGWARASAAAGIPCVIVLFGKRGDSGSFSTGIAGVHAVADSDLHETRLRGGGASSRSLSTPRTLQSPLRRPLGTRVARLGIGGVRLQPV
jgi:hypothetical protein